MLNGFSQLKHIIFTLFFILSVFAYAQDSNRRLSFSSELNFYQGVGRYNVDDISFNNNGIAGSFLGTVHFKVADNFLIGVKGGYAGTNDPVRSMLVAGLDFLRYEQGKQSGWFSQLAIGAYLGERPRYSNGGFLEIKRGYAFPVWIFNLQPSIGFQAARLNDEIYFIRPANGGLNQVVRGDVNLFFLSISLALLLR